MLTLLLLLVLCASLFPARPVRAAGGTFIWANSIGGDLASSINVDPAGNVYTTGSFEGTVDFDPGPGTATLASAGFEDTFISKLDSHGNYVWARGIGGTGFDWGTDITLDSAGNVYLIGSFEDTVDFDPGTGTATLTSAGSNDAFVLKLDSNGNLVWAKSMGGLEWDGGSSLAVDVSGDVLTTGDFQGTIDFDSGPSTTNLTSAGSTDVFVSKLDGNGNLIWARSMGGVSADGSSNLALDMSGNVLIIGDFAGTADFDPGPGTATLTSAGQWAFFIAKLDSHGNYVWARDIGSNLGEINMNIALDPAGNVYTAGSFEGTLDFDPGPGTTNLTSAGQFDAFVLKLDSNGSFLWARSMGGVEGDDGWNLAVDAASSVYTTGFFEGTVDFDPGPKTANLTSVGASDVFIAKLDSHGNYAWVRRMGGAGGDGGRAITVDASGNVYTTGTFFGTADFDPGPGTFSLTSGATRHIFIVKLQEAPIFADVTSGYWALDFIERLYMAGITGGCATNPLRYCPEDTVTRAQMSVFLLRGIHTSSYTPPAVGSTTGFGDVPVDYWAAAFIKQLAAEGITSGCGGGNYCPEQPVTRAQMAVFLLRAKYGASYTPPDVGAGTGFADVPPGYWAAAFVKQLVTEGITSGCGSGNYCPEQPVTRAQMAVFLVRTFSLP